MLVANIGSRVGSYAVSTVNSQPWLSVPIKGSAGEKVKKSRATRQIVNPIFLECAHTITDPFWVDLFNSAGYGKFPRRFGFKNGLLTYRKATRVITTELTKSPYEATSIAINFFKKYGGIVSEQDAIDSREADFNRGQAEEPMAGWGDLPKKTQEALIDTYISEMTTTMSLTPKQKLDLRHVINVGIVLKYFTRDNIAIEDNRITSIDGLLFDQGRGRFSFDSSLQPKVTRNYAKKEGDEVAMPKDSVPLYLREWSKIVDKIKLKWSKKIKTQNSVVIHGEAPATPDSKRLRLVVSTAETSTETC